MRLLLICFLLAQTCCALAREIILAPAAAAHTMHDAILAASDGDTIRIRPGTYRCVNESITKSVAIIGEGSPTLDGQQQDEVLVLTGHDILVSGINICNTKCGSMKDYAGLRVFHGYGIRIENCHLSNTFFGIYLSDSKRIKVRGCTGRGAHFGKSDTGNGIHLWKCDSIDIKDCTMEGHRDGIYLEFSKHCTIERNFCSRNFRYGLHFMFSDDDTYRSNTFAGNGTGVAVMYSKGVHMFSNTFKNNWGDASYGLLLKDMSNGRIQGNTFENNTVGITMEGGSNMYFDRNDFIANGYALKVMANCRLDTFTGNNFTANTFDAATNGELKENLFEKNYWDKYEGYDLRHDGIGDIPFRPVSLYAILVEKMPYAVMLMHSFTIEVLNRAEKSVPSIVPETFVDTSPLMKKIIRQ